MEQSYQLETPRIQGDSFTSGMMSFTEKIKELKALLLMRNTGLITTIVTEDSISEDQLEELNQRVKQVEKAIMEIKDFLKTEQQQIARAQVPPTSFNLHARICNKKLSCKLRN